MIAFEENIILLTLFSGNLLVIHKHHKRHVLFYLSNQCLSVEYTKLAMSEVQIAQEMELEVVEYRHVVE